MILIADSGSTKTDWRLLNGDEVKELTSKGLNPLRISEEEFKQEVNTLQLDKDLIKEVYFYGAGCGNATGKERVLNYLTNLFPSAVVTVEGDILGAALSVAEGKVCMVAILGTGSNVCYFDGNNIVNKIPSLGYLLGDEGSGTYIGKLFLKALLMDIVEPTVKERFYKKHGLTPDEVIAKLYSEEGKQFIGAVSKWLFQIRDKESSVYGFVLQAFHDFFDLVNTYFPQYKSYPLHVVGSVGYFWSNVLKDVAKEKGFFIGTIVEKPIAGLVVWHKGG